MPLIQVIGLATGPRGRPAPCAPRAREKLGTVLLAEGGHMRCFRCLGPRTACRTLRWSRTCSGTSSTSSAARSACPICRRPKLRVARDSARSEFASPDEPLVGPWRHQRFIGGSDLGREPGCWHPEGQRMAARREARRPAAAPGSSASVIARTTTTRRAPASRTSSRLFSSMPPIANHGLVAARPAA